jgi:hypothetical protein
MGWIVTVGLCSGCSNSPSSSTASPDPKITWTEYLKLSPEEQAAQSIIDRLDDAARAKLEARTKKSR